MNTRQVLVILKADGWYKVGHEGSHMHFKHPFKPGKVTVKEGVEHYHPKTLKTIWEQAGLK